MIEAKRKQIVTMFRHARFMRPRELERAGVPRWALYELAKEGVVTRRGRGIYTLPDAPITENHSYAEAVKRVPRGIICLISALRFHGLTMQNPAEVWVAIPRGEWQPKSDGLRLRIVQFSGKALTTGIETHQIEGVKIAVTNVARTVVDCFKFRNKIGTDVAVEALRDGWNKKRFTMKDLWHYAGVYRMSRVMMPYLETLD
jgi:predicted transcriptional regulator of viral defense system